MASIKKNPMATIKTGSSLFLQKPEPVPSFIKFGQGQANSGAPLEPSFVENGAFAFYACDRLKNITNYIPPWRKMHPQVISIIRSGYERKHLL